MKSNDSGIVNQMLSQSSTFDGALMRCKSPQLLYGIDPLT